MPSWAAFEQAAPELAAFGRGRLVSRVAYLATVRKDGAPRVHPVSPFIGGGRLFVFMFPTSPKGKDLQREPRFALHTSVEDSSGGKGEFLINGRAVLIEGAAIQKQAAEASGFDDPLSRYILFELTVERVLATTYPKGDPVHERWPG